MKSWISAQALFLASLCMAAAASAQPGDLRSPSAFDSISDRGERSRALFAEAGKVISSPRCMNCHPKGDSPTQADDMHPHLPKVVRGADGNGAIGIACTTCHQTKNFDASNVPGNPAWHLAPQAMAWQGQSLAQICVQLKDPKRNGGKTLAQIHEHMASDPLVGWGWAPGGTRAAAPGTQARLGALVQAWIDSGAACPTS